MHHWFHFFNHFRRLQWKLTLSYTFITLLALLFVEGGLGISTFATANANAPQSLAYLLAQKGRTLGSSFETLDQHQLTQSLTDLQPTSHNMPISYEGYVLAVNAQAQIVASVGAQKPDSLEAILPSATQQKLRSLLAGRVIPSGEVDPAGEHTYILAAIQSDAGQPVKGALLIDARHIQLPVSFLFDRFPLVVYAVLISFIFLLFATGVIGTVFGFFTARGFVRRFKRLFVAVDKWSQGDFSVFVQDVSGDELGQLARQLNLMAGQLQNLLQARQEIAMLEERNRLARDLHDSVKQQVFAISMQVSTARALLPHSSKSAEQHLDEAETLVRQAQQELSTLIRELRPVALEEKGLPRALQDLASAWSSQNGIGVEVTVEGRQVIPQPLEEAYFRITQEALSNIARHSQASLVQIRLLCEEQIELFICDNGRGFDLTSHHGRGVGLLSMQERMHSLGGEIVIESAIGKGTSIHIQNQPIKDTIHVYGK
ncbi:sensor histidine kinase [Tengunoibacter tsumagoiensis]|uniref:HAMP domain-containing protein n=1 Tax=Tengunoibacter tsumagoiensis TaxID=2014871 RepID=A0A401ZWZ6_9CHLR|nr:sensor histidine kinase [Tengunoibacter tsumagoiensis]GCE11342.1 hypothetical protein KTT_12010 [Tengunoibacter tsumagoiensis]